MLRHGVSLCGLAAMLSLPVLAGAQVDCTVTGLPQGDAAPQAAAVARVLATTNPCKVVPGFTARSLTSVWSSLLSSTKTGGRRLEAPVPPGTPQGLTLPERQMVHFDFSEVAAEQPRLLRVEVDGRQIVSLNNPPVQFDLPVRGFGPDQAFVWNLTTGRGAYRAEFRLLPDDTRQDVETRLARLATEALDPVSKLVYTAAIYDDADLFSQRDRTFLQIRRAAHF